MNEAEAFVDSLMHAGVKGMKWGVRKDSSDSSTSKTTNTRAEKTEKLGRRLQKVGKTATVVGAVGLLVLSDPLLSGLVSAGGRYAKSKLMGAELSRLQRKYGGRDSDRAISQGLQFASRTLGGTYNITSMRRR